MFKFRKLQQKRLVFPRCLCCIKIIFCWYRKSGNLLSFVFNLCAKCVQNPAWYYNNTIFDKSQVILFIWQAATALPRNILCVFNIPWMGTQQRFPSILSYILLLWLSRLWLQPGKSLFLFHSGERNNGSPLCCLIGATDFVELLWSCLLNFRFQGVY